MAVTVSFGKINKKVNSTNNVFLGTAIDVDVVLKNDTSIIKPVFVINHKVDALKDKDWFTFNYCYCADFHRYYWIDDVIVNSNYMVEVYCHVDVLASFYDMFKTQEFMVKYCSDKTLANLSLDDERLQPEIETGSEQNWGNIQINGKNLFDTVGTVALTCVTNLTDSSGTAYSTLTGLATYLMKFDTLKFLFGNLNGFWGKWGAQQDGALPDPITSISDAMEWVGHIKDVLSASNDAKNLIVSCKWTPVNFELAQTLGTQVSKMYIGSLPISVNDVYVLGNGTGIPIITGYSSQLLPIVAALNNYPDAEDSSLDSNLLPFLWGNKYTSIKLIHPNGMQEINDNSFYNVDGSGNPGVQYAWVVSVCLVDGNYAVKIYSATDNSVDKLVATISGNLVIDLMAYTQAESATVAGDTMRFWGTAAAIAGGAAAATGAGLGATSVSALTTGTSMVTASQAGAGLATAASSFTPNLVGLKAAARGIGVYKGISNVMAAGKPSPSSATLNCNFSGIAGLCALVTAPVTGGKTWSNAISISTYSVLPSVIVNGQYSKYAKQFGFPCGKVLKLEDITVGSDPVYVECVNASFGEITATTFLDSAWPTPEEIASINDALNGGIYIYPGG